MGTERRICARRVLYSPEYLDMGSDNGGVVVNLSEGGLRFQAVRRVEPQSDVALSFSLDNGYRVDVNAHVVWVGPRGNSGGVAFKSLSADSRSLIREWLSKSDSEHEGDEPVSTEDFSEGNGKGSAQVAPITSAIQANEEETGCPARSTEELSLESEISESESRLGRVQEIFAPDEPLFGGEVANVTADIAEIPNPQSLASVSQREIPATTASVPLGKNEEVPAERQEAIPLASVPESPAIDPAVPTIRPLDSTAEQPLRERQRSVHSGGSFSAVLSISTWEPSDRAEPLFQGRSEPPESGVPLSPLRNAENIFARGRWALPQIEPEPRRGGKALIIAIICIVIAAIIALIAYTRTHRQQIGAALVHIGERVGNNAGQPKAPTGIPLSRQQAKSAGSAPIAAAPLDESAISAGSTKPTGAASSALSSPGAASLASSGAASSNSGVLIPKPSATSTSPAARPVALTSGQAQASKAAQTASKSSAVQKASPLGNQPGATAHSSSKSAASTAVPASNARAEYDRAERYLTGSGVPPDPVEAAEWFWRSFEAGYTQAALPLADLYLHGQGVSQSCTQARILLDAAARQGNAAAARKLGQLPDNCD